MNEVLGGAVFSVHRGINQFLRYVQSSPSKDLYVYKTDQIHIDALSSRLGIHHGNIKSSNERRGKRREVGYLLELAPIIELPIQGCSLVIRVRVHILSSTRVISIMAPSS